MFAVRSSVGQMPGCLRFPEHVEGTNHARVALIHPAAARYTWLWRDGDVLGGSHGACGRSRTTVAFEYCSVSPAVLFITCARVIVQQTH